MKLVTLILGIFFIIDVSALGKIHNAVPIYTDKPFATIGNIDYLYNESPVGKYLESIYIYQVKYPTHREKYIRFDVSQH